MLSLTLPFGSGDRATTSKQSFTSGPGPLCPALPPLNIIYGQTGQSRKKVNSLSQIPVKTGSQPSPNRVGQKRASPHRPSKTLASISQCGSDPSPTRVRTSRKNSNLPCKYRGSRVRPSPHQSQRVRKRHDRVRWTSINHHRYRCSGPQPNLNQSKRLPRSLPLPTDMTYSHNGIRQMT